MRPIKKVPLILGMIFILGAGLLMSSCSPKDDCRAIDPHPIGQNIAENYSTDYEQVMDWYCQDHEFDDIILALETASLVPDYSGDTLLTMRTDGLTWDEIWTDIGLTH